jgi:hypothetical protein
VLHTELGSSRGQYLRRSISNRSAKEARTCHSKAKSESSWPADAASALVAYRLPKNSRVCVHPRHTYITCCHLFPMTPISKYTAQGGKTGSKEQETPPPCKCVCVCVRVCAPPTSSFVHAPVCVCVCHCVSLKCVSCAQGCVRSPEVTLT